MTGIVYLLHFSQKLSHSQHYIGWTEESARVRLAVHGNGRGAKIVAAAKAAGIDVCLVRAWRGKTREFERKLKNKKCGPKLCPICNPGTKSGRA